MRAFDQSIVERVLGSIQDTDQVGRQIWGGVVFPIAMPSIAPNGTDYFKLDSTRFRIPVLHYDLYVAENADDSMAQFDNNFQVAFVLDKGARSEVLDGSNVEPEFFKIWARADRLGRYLYNPTVPPRQNVRYMDRFEILQDHLVEVPPQWDWNSALPSGGIAHDYDYNDSRWQGVMPWDESVYQPRPGFPGPWTHPHDPDPRTPYVQGDGADMTREFRWGQETIQFGQPYQPCNALNQTQTTPVTGTFNNVDDKYTSGTTATDNPGLWGITFDADLLVGVNPQRPMGLWDHMLAGYATIGYHYNSEVAREAYAQQTHRLVKQREGARCVRTNNATYLNDVAILIDGKRTNFIRHEVDISNVGFMLMTKKTPGLFDVASYNKMLYWTVWAEGNTFPTSIIPTVHVKLRIEFEAI